MTDAKYFPPKSMTELLELMRDKPAMFLGRKSLYDLSSWIEGFCFAIKISNKNVFDMDVDFVSFDKYVQNKYEWHDVGGWSYKIRYRYRDEANAFDEFYRLYDEFQLTNSKL